MELSPKDLIITTWCSEKKSSWSLAEDNGIRVIHLPTGTVVTCESERSQHRNKAKALKELEEKLQDHPDLDGTDY